MTALRKFTAAFQILIIIFAVFLSGINASAQFLTKTKSAARIAGGRALSDGRNNGALITWETSFELGNLGFNIYRLDKGEQILVNKTLIPGSAFIVGDRTPFHTGKSYSFFDADGLLGSEYTVETVLINGRRSRFNLRTKLTAEVLPVEKSGKIFAGENGGLWQQEFKDEAKPAGFALSNNSADPNTQRSVAAQAGVKITVKTEGLYRITRQQLADAGFNINTPVANWQLYANGIEQNLIVTGEQGGVLGANGYIEFFGYGADSSYTNTRVYYLVSGAAEGKRMIYAGGGDSPNRTAVSSYPAVTECKNARPLDCNKPIFYFPNPRNGNVENFYGSIIFNGEAPLLKLNVPFLDWNSAQAVLDVSLQGYSSNAHLVQVSLNGIQLGTITGDGVTLMQASFNVPAGVLKSENSIQLTVPNSGDSNLVDYVRLRYNRRYHISSGKLLFPVAPQRTAQVYGFTSPEYRIFDVTDVNNVNLFKHEAVENTEGYSAVVETGASSRLLYAVADNAALSPPAITANIPSNLYNTTQNKDLIIVTYKDWRTQADALADYRQGQGLTVAVVDVEDIYDEFSFGMALPDGLKAFFQHTAPNYAILMGDATLDPKNHLGLPAWIPNFVPSFRRDSVYGEIVSDEVFGDFLDDKGNPGTNAVSEFPIGRLPARSVAEAQAMVNKIISFEQNLPTSPFERGALFINDDLSGNNDFFATNQNMAKRLPAGTTVQHIQRNGATIETAGPVRAAIVNAVNQGPLIIGYAGHSSLTAWTSAFILRNNEASSFTNGANGRYSLFFFLTCLNGAFADFNSDSLAEAIFKAPNGGGVAVWSSSGLTIADGQDVMAEKFYDLHSQAAAGTRLGNLTKPARLHSFDPDVRGSWILFGDPTLKVK